MSVERQPLLSICIPTFNRALLLREAVESVLSQADAGSASDVEIVISDNASTDETAPVVEQIRATAKIPIKYFKNATNLGFDGNCLKVVDHAAGQYVWLFGSDDLLATGALASVVEGISKLPRADLIFGEKEDFYQTPDRAMRFRPIMNVSGETYFDFKNKETVDEYFKRNKRLVAYCNYLSNIIFSRDKWLRVKNKERYLDTAYVHVYVFQSILWGGEPGTLRYLPVPLVKRRWGNDGRPELERDIGLHMSEARLKQDVLMYRKIAEAVFSERKYVRAIDDLVLRNDGYSWAVRAKLTDPKRFCKVILPFLFRAYWDHWLFWLKIVPLVFLPNILLRSARGVYRKLIKGEPLSLREMLED